MKEGYVVDPSLKGVKQLISSSQPPFLGKAYIVFGAKKDTCMQKDKDNNGREEGEENKFTFNSTRDFGGTHPDTEECAERLNQHFARLLALGIERNTAANPNDDKEGTAILQGTFQDLIQELHGVGRLAQQKGINTEEAARIYITEKYGSYDEKNEVRPTTGEDIRRQSWDEMETNDGGKST